MAKRLIIDLKPELSRFLNQERSRLKTQYGLSVTSNDIIRTLLELHRLRVINAAGEDGALLWYYMKLEDLERDNATIAATTAKPTTGSKKRSKAGRPPKPW